MKKINLFVLAIMAVIFSSCEPKMAIVNYYQDFRDFYDNGFFVTVSNTVPFEYIPVGYIILTDVAGIIYVPETDARVRKDTGGDDDTEGIYYNPNKGKKRKWVKATSNSALEEIKKIAADKGADGILNVRVEPCFASEKSATPYGYRVYGMLFKRKN